LSVKSSNSPRETRRQLWQPPGETIEAIAAVLGAHWAAAKSQQLQLFSLETTGSWLRQLGWRNRLTTLRAAAD
jgi:hypothetical protein